MVCVEDVGLVCPHKGKFIVRQIRKKYLLKKKIHRQANKQKISARDKIYYEENKEKISIQKKTYRSNNRDKVNGQKKIHREENMYKRIQNLCKTFGRIESDVMGTIYHFGIGDGYKVGKSIHGYDGRYCNTVKDEAHSVTEWIMSESDMDALEKVILHVTKSWQYEGTQNLLWDTANTEIRTVNCEVVIDTLIMMLGINAQKIN